MSECEQLTQHALQLSPDIAEAHATLHDLYIVRDLNWPAAKGRAGAGAGH